MRIECDSLICGMGVKQIATFVAEIRIKKVIAGVSDHLGGRHDDSGRLEKSDMLEIWSRTSLNTPYS
jgi:hypothetical protein